MSATSTSIYANTWRAIYRLLNEQSWPAGGSNGVKVFACSYGQDGPPDENVLLLTEPSEGSDQVWGPVGEHRKDESFLVNLEVNTVYPWPSWEKALDRLEAITAVIEQMFHSTNRTAQRAANVPELAAVLKGWSVVNVNPQIIPMADGTFGGGALMQVRVDARIHPTANPA